MHGNKKVGPQIPVPPINYKLEQWTGTSCDDSHRGERCLSSKHLSLKIRIPSSIHSRLCETLLWSVCSSVCLLISTVAILPMLMKLTNSNHHSFIFHLIPFFAVVFEAADRDSPSMQTSALYVILFTLTH